MPQNEIKRGGGYGNDNIDVLLGILGTVKIGKAPLLGSFSSERQIQYVAQQNDILSGGLIEYGFHPIVDCPMRRSGPAFRRKQDQNFFGTRRLIGAGVRRENADRQQAAKGNPGEYAGCEGRTHAEKTLCPNFNQKRGSIALNVLFFNRYRGVGKTQLRPTTTIIKAGCMDQSPIYKLAARVISFGRLGATYSKLSHNLSRRMHVTKQNKFSE